MRKLVVSMNVTLDGFAAGPDGGLDWHFGYWNAAMTEYLREQLSHADTILLGRVTYQAMAAYWPEASREISYPRQDLPFADMMNRYAKIVCSATLEKTEWNNASLLRSADRESIGRLKGQPGKDIIVYGSRRLVSSLVQWDLVDEYILWVHPVVLGKGRPLFAARPRILRLKLLMEKAFPNGVIVLFYTPERENDLTGRIDPVEGQGRAEHTGCHDPAA